MLGMPLPDATRWELVEQVADSVYPVYDLLMHLGAQQRLVYQDDTGARILSMIQENKADPPPERKAMYTAVLQFEGEHRICLYFTGRYHAGEYLDAALALLDPNLPPIQWMSDGLAMGLRDRLVADVTTLVSKRRDLKLQLLWDGAPEMWNLLEEGFTKDRFSCEIHLLVDLYH